MRSMRTSASVPFVAICVATYRRLDGLQRLLSSLSELHFTETRPDIAVIVVDNDPDAKTTQLDAGLTASFPWRLDLLREPRRGIPNARNRALSRALPEADFVAFIDDDETAAADWLDKLLSTIRETGAGVVAGPVVPVLPRRTAPWLARSGLFERPRWPSGTELQVAATNNVLVRSEVFADLNRFFDPRLSATGGSDTELFERVRQAGWTIVWCDDAIVWEFVPPNRARVWWLLRRSFRGGGGEALRRRRKRELPGPLGYLPRGLWGIARGLVKALASLPRGRVAVVEQLRRVAESAGFLVGTFGWYYREYRR